MKSLYSLLEISLITTQCCSKFPNRYPFDKPQIISTLNNVHNRPEVQLNFDENKICINNQLKWVCSIPLKALLVNATEITESLFPKDTDVQIFNIYPILILMHTTRETRSMWSIDLKSNDEWKNDNIGPLSMRLEH
jgi:hypothetical protein